MDRRKQTTYKRRSAEYGGRQTAAAPVQNVQAERTAPARQKRRKFVWTKRSLMITTGLLVLFVGGGATYAQLGPSLTQSSSSGVNLQSGLMAWWKMDGNINNATPRKTNCTLSGTGGTGTTDRKGQAGKALFFSNSGATTFNCGTPAGLSFGSALTLSAWVKGNSWSNSVNGIVSYGSGGYWLYVNDSGYPCLYVQGGANTDNVCASSSPLATGQWYNITATYASSQIIIYVNGVSALQTTPTVTQVSNYGVSFFIGCSKGSGGRCLNGSIDDLRLYRRAINANEAKALADGYNPTTNIGSGERGLVGWWKMDGNSNDSTPYRRTNSRTSTTSVADRKGAANSAYTTNGTSNSGIDINTNSATDPLTSFSTFTMSAWVRFDAAPSTGCRTVIYKRATFSSNNPGFAMYWCFANNNFAVDFGNSSSNRWDTGYVPTVGVWTHYAYTYSGGTGRLYINGTLYGTSTAGSLANAQVQSGMSLGKAGNQGNYGMGGALDDVRIYNRELTANEVNAQYKSYNSQISINSNSNSVNTSTGLIGYWPFNGNANDSTPYRSNGVVSNAVLTTDRQGRSNSAYSFDGATDRLITATGSVLRNANSNRWTMSAWIYPTSLTGTGVIARLSGDGGGYFIRTSGTSLQSLFSASGNSSSYSQNSIGTLVVNQWQLVTATYDGTTIRHYINGASVGSIGWAGPLKFNQTAPLTIGYNQGSSERFAGSIDDVRIYNRALTANDVAKLYTDYR